DFEISRPKYAFGRWQHPRFVHQLGERDTAPSNPRVPRTRHHDERRIVEKFETKFLVSKTGRSASNQEVDLTLSQFTAQSFRFLSCDEVKHHSRIARREPFDDGRNEDFGEIGAASDPHFPGSGVGETLDLLDSLAQVIEYGRAAFEERTTVF